MASSWHFERFKQTLDQTSPPRELSPTLQALWHDAKGEWDIAHSLAQQSHGRDGAWVHAYLHRKEGDTGNAAYWYSRANQPVCRLSLDEEWENIARTLLAEKR